MGDDRASSYGDRHWVVGTQAYLGTPTPCPWPEPFPEDDGSRICRLPSPCSNLVTQQNIEHETTANLQLNTGPCSLKRDCFEVSATAPSRLSLGDAQCGAEAVVWDKEQRHRLKALRAAMQRLGCFGLTAEMQNGSSDDVYCSKQLRSRPEACAERVFN